MIEPCNCRTEVIPGVYADLERDDSLCEKCYLELLDFFTREAVEALNDRFSEFDA